MTHGALLMLRWLADSWDVPQQVPIWTVHSHVLCLLCALMFVSIGAVALTLGAVPDGTGQIWLDNVNCRGTETRLVDCPANPLGNHNCAHVEDA